MNTLSRAMDDLIDSSIGVIKRVYEVGGEPGTPNLFHYAAEAANTEAFGYLPNFSSGGGASTDRPRAIAKAVGEAIERYCAAIYVPDDLPLAAAETAPFPCVAPEAFALYLPQQYDEPGFPWSAVDRSTPIRWTYVRDLISNNIVFAPAAFVWIPYQYSQTMGEAPIGQPISTGLACHDSLEKAALSGLCEVVERDSFTLFWQARMSPPQVRVETLSDTNYDLVHRFEITGDKVSLLDITTDVGVPTVLSILRSSSIERPAHVFAAAADLDPEVAVRKALEELGHTRRYSAQVLRIMDEPTAENGFEEVEQQAHHLRLAAAHGHDDAFAFAFASTRRVDFGELPILSTGSPADDLGVVTRAIHKLGLTPYLADLTSPDVRPYGLHVVRALVPGMHPLFMGHRSRARGGQRLYRVPQLLGHLGLHVGQPDNAFPHPYP